MVRPKSLYFFTTERLRQVLVVEVWWLANLIRNRLSSTHFNTKTTKSSYDDSVCVSTIVSSGWGKEERSTWPGVGKTGDRLWDTVVMDRGGFPSTCTSTSHSSNSTSSCSSNSGICSSSSSRRRRRRRRSRSGRSGRSGSSGSSSSSSRSRSRSRSRRRSRSRSRRRSRSRSRSRSSSSSSSSSSSCCCCCWNKQSLRPRPSSLFLPYSTNKDCGPVVVLTPPPRNNLSAIPFLCFFLIVQTKTVAPLLFWPPPLQQPFYKQRLWPLVLFWPPPLQQPTHKKMLNRWPLTRRCWIHDHSQEDVE